MKVVKIMGGLGNQMFGYAFALALSESSRQKVMIDTQFYKTCTDHNGYELSSLFNLSLKEASNFSLLKVTTQTKSRILTHIFRLFPFLKKEIQEDYTKHYPSIISSGKDGYYIGYWQWYKYFDAIKSKVVNEFQFKNPLEGKNAELQNELLISQDSVSIHVRRGDYLKYPSFANICEVSYYKKAIERAKQIIGEEAHFAIFSNDIEWCRENIVPLCEEAKVTLVDWNIGKDSSNDMRLMSVCRINILANSTFSWWGGYLNQREDRHVIAPYTWINRTLDYRIQCDDWECI